jgi:type II secretory pathway component PulF
VIADSYAEFGYEPPWMLSLTDWLSRYLWWWVALPPLAVAIAVAVWWRWSGRSSAASSRGIATVGRLLRLGRLAVFADLLGLLTENGVPQAEAVQLAAGAAGDRALQSDAAVLAQRVESGPEGGEPPHLRTIPRLLAWTVLAAGSHRNPAAALRRLADGYRREANRVADWLRVYLPILATLVIGGTIAAVYSLTLLAPWFLLLQRVVSELE